MQPTLPRRTLLQVALLTAVAGLPWVGHVAALRAEALRKGLALVEIAAGGHWRIARFAELRKDDVFRALDPKDMSCPDASRGDTEWYRALEDARPHADYRQRYVVNCTSFPGEPYRHG